MTHKLYYTLPRSKDEPYMICRSDTEKLVAYCYDRQHTEMIVETFNAALAKGVMA